MRLTNEVYLVGGGPTFCFGLSADPDCHVYLIDGGDALALIDAGTDAGSVDRIVANIVAEGLDPGRLRTLLLTHYHLDHAGAAAAWRARFGLEVVAPRGAVPALRTGDERAIALDVAKRAGIYAPDARLPRVAVDRALDEGDVVCVGALELTTYDTPGHCDGHASFLLAGRDRRFLFAGDAVLAGGRVILQNIHDCSIQESAASIAKLDALAFDALLPGHGVVVLDEGKRHVALAAEACDNLFVPKNFP